MLRPFSTNVDIDISPPTRSPRVHGTTRIVHGGFTREIIRLSCAPQKNTDARSPTPMSVKRSFRRASRTRRDGTYWLWTGYFAVFLTSGQKTVCAERGT